MKKKHAKTPEHKHERLRFDENAKYPAKRPRDKNRQVQRHIVDTQIPEQREASSDNSAQQASRDKAPSPGVNPAVPITNQTSTPHIMENVTVADGEKRPGRLQFSEDERPPEELSKGDKKAIKKADTAQRKFDRSNAKLEKAQAKLPVQRKLKRTAIYDGQTGKTTKKLQFEKQAKPMKEHIKGPLPLRPVKAGANIAIGIAHKEIFQAERENVGLKAAHRGEMIAEAGIRSALRYRKTKPYRKAAKLEKAAAKRSVKLEYRKTLAQNPKLRSNLLSRMQQKRMIKKNYAKAARNSKKAAQAAKKAGSAASKAAKAVTGFIKRHPVITITIVLLALVIYLIMNTVSMMGSVGGSSAATIVAGTYPSENEDMLGAEDAYAQMEAELQDYLDNYEQHNPGYDEYVYNLDRIWHDPYVLISMLSAMHEGAWTIDGVQGTLGYLFGLQYTLTENVVVEKRTRTETQLQFDSATGTYIEVEVEVEYDYYIVYVTLGNFNLSHLPIHIMGEESLSRYAFFMGTLGNRPDLFPVSDYPEASYYKEPGCHDVPQAYLDADPVFAAMIKEAEKHLGRPYIWGGYSPSTSFDCSGFVSWVLNQSGWDIGRLGAQGLYNISTPVPESSARPGDLVFFKGTYDAPDPNGVTHVGIYAGDGMMIHAGNPIGYESLNTSYYQAHFFAFGRP